MRLVSYDEFCTSDFRRLWKQLLRANAVYDMGQTYEWVKTWWETYHSIGRWKKRWFLLAHEGNNRNIDGLFPIVIRERFGLRVVEYLGQSKGFTTDYVGFVGARAQLAGAVNSLFTFLLEREEQWDVLSLQIPEWCDGLWPYLTCRSLSRDNARVKWRVDVPECSVALALPTDFDLYLSSLGRRTRADVRRYLRAIRADDGSLHIHRGGALLHHLQALLRLNSCNWTVFQGDHDRHFMVQVMSELIAGEEPVFLAELRVGHESLAAVQGFENSDRCFLHTAGVMRSTSATFSPGHAMYAMLIQDMIQQRRTVLDLSPGLEQYKLHFGGIRIEPVYRLEVQHRRSRNIRWTAFQFLLKNAGPWIARIRGNVRSGGAVRDGQSPG
jgi:hypothetical protein